MRERYLLSYGQSKQPETPSVSPMWVPGTNGKAVKDGIGPWDPVCMWKTLKGLPVLDLFSSGCSSHLVNELSEWKIFPSLAVKSAFQMKISLGKKFF